MIAPFSRGTGLAPCSKMSNDRRPESLTREGWKLISDDEVGGACAAEAAFGLSDGDEYLDLRRLMEGVRKARGTALPTEHVLARKAVHEDTWTRIVAQLAALPIQNHGPARELSRYPSARSIART
jgi:hypothetical protein